MAEEYIIGSDKGSGGWRNGGRKRGKKIGPIKPATVNFHRRVTPEEVEKLQNFLDELRKNK